MTEQVESRDPYRGGHYAFEINGVRMDVYRIADLYGPMHPCRFHVLKKALRAGEGHKSLLDDIDDMIATLERWKVMIKEDEEWNE
jgi:hypothetical protein